MERFKEACATTARVAVKIFSWSHRKKLEEVDFVVGEFLHKKINNKGIFMWIMVCYRRYNGQLLSVKHSNMYMKDLGLYLVDSKKHY